MPHVRFQVLKLPLPDKRDLWLSVCSIICLNGSPFAQQSWTIFGFFICKLVFDVCLYVCAVSTPLCVCLVAYVGWQMLFCKPCIIIIIKNFRLAIGFLAILSRYVFTVKMEKMDLT